MSKKEQNEELQKELSNLNKIDFLIDLIQKENHRLNDIELRFKGCRDYNVLYDNIHDEHNEHFKIEVINLFSETLYFESDFVLDMLKKEKEVTEIAIKYLYNQLFILPDEVFQRKDNF